jgi:hypothetical protein
MPLTALTGISAGISGRSFTCDGSVRYGSIEMKCWISRQNDSRHGELEMSQALVKSCSCFWYQFGNAAGIEHLEAIGRKIGFGASFGILEGERQGVLPGPAWMKENRPSERGSPAYMASTSIGQGRVLATPLQMAVLAATIGNRGLVPQPALLSQERKSDWRADLSIEGLPAAEIEKLREGMREVVNGENGTGKAVVSGKTGTAQYWRLIDGKKVEDNHGWFIGFAPYDKPTLAFAILKQGAKSGGGDCAPIAKRIVEETLALPAGGSGEVLPVDTAQGNLDAARKESWKRFDARKAEFSLHIEAVKKACGEGLLLKPILVFGGRLSIQGEASGMVQALDFRQRLMEVSKGWEVEWSIPVPKTLSDGKRVSFTMKGEDASPGAKPVSKNIRLKTSSVDAAIHPNPTLLKNWQILQRRAGLADLPESAVLVQVEERDKPGGQYSGFVGFTGSKQEVRKWLEASLSVVHLKIGGRESAQSSNGRLYPAPNHCWIRVAPFGGGRERVLAYWRSIILIAD